MARHHHHGHLVSHLRASAPLADLLRSAPSLPAARAAHARSLKSPFAAETFLLNTLISAYALLGRLRDACRVFDGISHPNTFSYNALLSAHARLGCPADALALFDAIPDPDQCSYNAVIAALAQHGRGGDALRFLAAMHADDFVLDAYSFASALSACSAEKDSRTGEQVHALVSKSPHAKDVYIGSALVDMYAKCERPEEARRVFEAMSERNVVSWNSLITCYEQNGPVDEALVLFVRMMNTGFVPDEVTLASVMSACAGLAADREGRQVHARVVKSDRFREDMVLNNALGHGKQIHAYMIRNDYEIDDILRSALVDMYSKCRLFDYSIRVFEAGPSHDVILWNSMIFGCAYNGKGEFGLELFDEMRKRGIRANCVTFLGALVSCISEGHVGLGRSYFTLMTDEYSIVPRIEHYECMIELLGKHGYMVELEDFVEHMPFEPTTAMWLRIFDCCRI